MRPHTRRRSVLTIRPLESRLAPATLVNATTVTYQDLDHDTVTVRFSKPLLTATNAPSVFSFDSAFDTSTPQQLSVLNLGNFTAGQPVGGMSVTVSAVRTATGGDNLVNVGYILAGGIDLGSVTVKGDLGGIDAGDANSATMGLMSLTVQSMGRFGLSTGGVGSLVSGIEGKLGSLVVKSDIVGAFIQVFGSDAMHDADGKIGKISVGGSLIGGTDNDSGAIQATGNIGAATIKGDVVGGSGRFSGYLGCTNGNIASVTVDGSILGGMGYASGRINGDGDVGAVKIGHDLKGLYNQSGAVFSAGKLASVSIGGSLVGGSDAVSGAILSVGDMGPVKIGHDMEGSLASRSPWINSDGKLAGVSIGGSLLGDSGVESGEISSAGDMGLVKIAHDLLGGTGAYSGYINSGAKLAGVSIGGSLIGGSGLYSGRIAAAGDLGLVRVRGNVRAGTAIAGNNTSAALSGEIETKGNLAGVTIGGVLTGEGGGEGSGLIASKGDLGPVRIGGDIRGGGEFAGAVASGFTIEYDPNNMQFHVTIEGDGDLDRVSVGGSVIGGSGRFSGLILGGGNMDSATIAGDVLGGAGQDSGEIQSFFKKIASVTIGGSLIGGNDGTYPDSGIILGKGDIGPVTIAGDIRGGPGLDSGELVSTNGKIAGLTVGGSLIGGGSMNSGFVSSGGSLGLVKVGGDIRGGLEMNAGSMVSGGDFAGATVGGSLIGGIGGFSADIFSNANLGPVTIAGDVRGGDGGDSAEIFADGTLTRVTVGGSLVGGSMKDRSGLIDSNGPLGPVFIGGDVTGGSAITLDRSGFIHGQRIASVFIGGSMITGTDLDMIHYYPLTHNASIQADQDLGPVTVLGSLVGNPTFTINVNGVAVTTEGTPVIIAAVGHASLSPGATNDVAIASLKVGGRVEFADILAGYDVILSPVNGDAQIGAVTVGTDWIASTLVAGIMTATYFGSGTDMVIPANSATRSSKIASIAIGGQVLGTPDSVDPFDHYAFESESIGSLKVGGTAIPLKVGAHNDDLSVGSTADVRAREL